MRRVTIGIVLGVLLWGSAAHAAPPTACALEGRFTGAGMITLPGPGHVGGQLSLQFVFVPDGGDPCSQFGTVQINSQIGFLGQPDQLDNVPLTYVVAGSSVTFLVDTAIVLRGTLQDTEGEDFAEAFTFVGVSSDVRIAGTALRR